MKNHIDARHFNKIDLIQRQWFVSFSLLSLPFAIVGIDKSLRNTNMRKRQTRIRSFRHSPHFSCWRQMATLSTTTSFFLSFVMEVPNGYEQKIDTRCLINHEAFESIFIRQCEETTWLRRRWKHRVLPNANCSLILNFTKSFFLVASTEPRRATMICNLLSNRRQSMKMRLKMANWNVVIACNIFQIRLSAWTIHRVQWKRKDQFNCS